LIKLRLLKVKVGCNFDDFFWQHLVNFSGKTVSVEVKYGPSTPKTLEKLVKDDDWLKNVNKKVMLLEFCWPTMAGWWLCFLSRLNTLKKL